MSRPSWSKACDFEKATAPVAPLLSEIHAAYAARLVVSVARPGAVALRHFHDVADAIIGNRRRRRAARRGQRDAGQPSIAVIGERIDHAIGVGERGRLPQRVPRDPKVEQKIDI